MIKKQKTVLVTGGAGYIGSHTVVELAQAGYDPVIFDNFSNSRPFVTKRIARILGRDVKVVKGDCVNVRDVERVFKKYGPFSGVVHFAALKAVEESIRQPLKYYRNNVDGLLTVVEASLAHKVKDFVFSSSCTVYGQPDRLPVRETTPLKEPESTYGETKQVSESILRAVVRGGSPLRVVSLRYFNPIGAHLSGLIGELPLGTPKNLVPFVTQTAAGKRKELVVFGNDYKTIDGTCIRDYIHVVDLSKAHVAALQYLSEKKPGPFYDVFNVGVGRGYSVLEIIQAFEKTTGVRVPYRFGSRRAGDIEKIYADEARTRKVLGWRAKLTIADALKSAWAWERTLAIGGM